MWSLFFLYCVAVPVVVCLLTLFVVNIFHELFPASLEALDERMMERFEKDES